MINLPKPSLLKTNGTPNEQIKYLLSYLNKLVPAIEKSFVRSENTDNKKIKYVKDISQTNNGLTVFYSDGSVKSINSK